MKQLFLCLMVILLAYNAKATDFTLVIAVTDTAYAHYVVATAAVDTDEAHIANLGTRPTPPVNVIADTSWSNFTSAVHTYDSSYTSLSSLLVTDKATKRTAELALLATLGYNTLYTNVPSNQWVKVQGSFPTAWIGYATNSGYIQVTTTTPTHPFTPQQ